MTRLLHEYLVEWTQSLDHRCSVEGIRSHPSFHCLCHLHSVVFHRFLIYFYLQFLHFYLHFFHFYLQPHPLSHLHPRRQKPKEIEIQLEWNDYFVNHGDWEGKRLLVFDL